MISQYWDSQSVVFGNTPPPSLALSQWSGHLILFFHMFHHVKDNFKKSPLNLIKKLLILLNWRSNYKDKVVWKKEPTQTNLIPYLI